MCLFQPKNHKKLLCKEYKKNRVFSRLFCKKIYTIGGEKIEKSRPDFIITTRKKEKNNLKALSITEQLVYQELFKNNMRRKGVQTKCYLCGCEIENILGDAVSSKDANRWAKEYYNQMIKGAKEAEKAAKKAAREAEMYEEENDNYRVHTKRSAGAAGSTFVAAKREATAKAKAEAERKAKEEKERKVKLEAERRAKAEADAIARLNITYTIIVGEVTNVLQATMTLRALLGWSSADVKAKLADLPQSCQS